MDGFCYSRPRYRFKPRLVWRFVRSHNTHTEGSVNAGLNLMNMMTAIPSNLSPALAKSLEEAQKELEATEERKREAIARALMPNQGKHVAKPVAKNLPAPPVAKPRAVVCKDERCELPGRLFIPMKATYELCPACSRRRKQEAEAKRVEEQRVRDQIEEMRRKTKQTERLIADLEAGKVMKCTNEGCENIERPGVGYDPSNPFRCFTHRKEYRERRDAGMLPSHGAFKAPARPSMPVVEDSATRVRKQAKFEAQELFMQGGETALPKGVSLHQRLDRQITLKFVSGGETFYHNFVLPIDQAAKRAQDADAKKRRHENRQRVDDAPRGKGGNKGQKNEGKKGRK